MGATRIASLLPLLPLSGLFTMAFFHLLTAAACHVIAHCVAGSKGSAVIVPCGHFLISFTV